MPLALINLNLNIQNNRNYPVNINFLGNAFNPLDTSNSTTEYRWNITTLSIPINDVLSLEYQTVGSAIFSLYTYTIINGNLDSLVIALNNLGIGFFNVYNELGQTYISTYNDNYIFGNLNIPPLPTPPILAYNFQTCTAGGNIDIDINAINVVSLVTPITQNGSLIVTNGDNVNFYGVANTLIDQTVSVLNQTTSTYIFSAVFIFPYVFPLWNFNFTTLSGNSYLVEVVENC